VPQNINSCALMMAIRQTRTGVHIGADIARGASAY